MDKPEEGPMSTAIRGPVPKYLPGTELSRLSRAGLIGVYNKEKPDVPGPAASRMTECDRHNFFRLGLCQNRDLCHMRSRTTKLPPATHPIMITDEARQIFVSEDPVVEEALRADQQARSKIVYSDETGNESAKRASDNGKRIRNTGMLLVVGGVVLIAALWYYGRRPIRV